ncbi:MAG: hypothetical protein IT368_07020 [Candidatus Hydrogenedentes bacterium]|nr:hypothetical protein [Candidatus Hydrogenedentota bacterium]
MKRSQKVELAVAALAVFALAACADAQTGASPEWLKTKNVLYLLLFGGGGIFLGSILGGAVGVMMRSKLACLLSGMLGAYVAVMIDIAFMATKQEATWSTLLVRSLAVGLPLALVIGGLVSILVWEVAGKRRMSA